MRNTPLCLDKEFALNSVPFQSSTRTTLLVEFTYWVLSNKWIHLQYNFLHLLDTIVILHLYLLFSKWFLLSMEAWTMIEYIFFLDPESDNTIFFTYCFSSNFLNLNMFLFFSKTIVNGILFKIYQSPNLFHLDVCKLNTTRRNNKKSCDTLFTICLTIKI